MRKLLFAYFYGLFIPISFTFLTITVWEASNKHCLLPFFHYFSNYLFLKSINQISLEFRILQTDLTFLDQLIVFTEKNLDNALRSN